MGENKRDIKRLIQLKSQRPAFARMISWDMSQAAETESGNRGKSKKKQKQKESSNMQDQVEEEDDCDSAGSSDYETANEDHVDELELSSTFSSITTDTTSSLDTVDIADEDNLDTDDDEDAGETAQCVPGDAACGGLQPGRRRRLSKRQKRNKRNLFKVTYMEELFNLADLFDMTNDIDNVFSETSDAVDSVEVSSRVPTLAELCLQATRCKRQRNKSGPKPNVVRPAVLPCGIKRIITDWRFNQRMLERQLSYLQNFVLSSLCDENGVKNEQIYYLEKSLRFPVRSVWCAFSHPVKNEDVGYQYPSETATAFLYHPTMRPLSNIMVNAISDYTQLAYLQNLTVSSTHCLSALATTIDLMLPRTLSARLNSQSSSTDSEVIASASETMIIRVKNALRARYPHLINELFDRAIPYVMWARGNIGQATQMFQALVQKETLDLHKAMYLSEIAVMHTMFGDSQTAASFYKLASEVAITGVSSDDTIKEITEQTQVLLASIHDCGLMTEEKARAALSCWSGAVHLPSPKMATVLGAADSFLCYHLRESTDEWWKEAESRLRTWYSSSKYLGYYVSLVLALRGKDLESNSEFREFRAHSGLTLPGEIIFPYLQKIEKKNPWNPLITIVKNQKVPVKPLKVVWRTQLRPSRLSKERPMETDLCSCDLNLRLSESGHLTGDLQMLMPPIREVTLDLHTGSVVLNNTPSFTGTWKATEIEITDASEKMKGTDFMLPTPCQIYFHEDGTLVHLMSPKLSPCHPDCYDNNLNIPCCPMVLTWKGPDGRTARINLINAVKTVQRKTLEELRPDKLLSEKAFEIVKGLIDIAFTKNLSLDKDDMVSAAKSIIRTNQTKIEKAAKKKKEQRTDDLRKHKQISREAQIKAMIPKKLHTILPRISLKLMEQPLQFGRALVIHLFCQRTNKSYWLLIDTSSREAFLNYKLNPLPGTTEHKHSYINRRRLESNVCQDKFFMGYTTETQLSIYNEKCDIVSTLDITDLKPQDYPNNNVNLCVVGDYIFGVNASRLSIWKDIIGSDASARDYDLQSTLSLAPYWELDDDRKQIDNILALGTEVKGKGQFLFVHMSVGLGLMDPDTMELIPVILPEDCILKLTEDGKVILGKFAECKLLAEKSFTEEDEALYRFIVGTENKLFLFSVSHRTGSDQLEASLLHYFFLPGIVKEACIIGKEVGLLVSLTQHEEHHESYREHVFHFRNDGLLHGVLLCLGHGPHSFCPLFIGEGVDGNSAPGWCVYMRDGHDGILCVKLFD